VIYAVIPALDEAENIELLFANLSGIERSLAPELELRVVLVDDGSSDGTAQVARAAAAIDLTVLRHEHPQGPGAAFATGFAALATVIHADDFVLTLEADNTSRLDILQLMLRRSCEGHDVVFASPYIYGGGIVGAKRSRTFLSHVANSYIKALLDIRGILTVSSFYRLYRGSAVSRLQQHYSPGIVESSGFECMVELTLKLSFLGMSISEVPMVLESDRRIGKSKMRITRTARGYFSLFRFKRRWRSQASSVGTTRRETDGVVETGRSQAGVGR
jgi:dolichol-phosphate mannosyltransferase